MVATDPGDSTDLTWSDDYTENTDTGVSLSVTQASNDVSLDYTTTNLGINSTIRYSITYLV
jgi:hypothetical protein